MLGICRDQTGQSNEVFQLAKGSGARLFITFLLCDATGQLERVDLNLPQRMQPRLFTKISCPQRPQSGAAARLERAHRSRPCTRLQHGKEELMDGWRVEFSC